MTKVAYFDCFSGCSGDMILAALLDAGLPLEALQVGLNDLPVRGYSLIVEKVQRASIGATRLKVVIDEGGQLTDHSLPNILNLIETSSLRPIVKERGCAIFQRLGEVESKVHGISLEEVHFHEVGAIDSIVDIIGSLIGFDILGITRFYSSSFALGSGNVSTDHGILPVPAPATLGLLAMAHAPVAESTNILLPEAELVTPTGAALITSLAQFGRPGMVIDMVGYGAGAKDFKDWPNILRLWVGEQIVSTNGEELSLLETNIDDMNPQIYSYVVDKLLAEGAVDVWLTPIQMKKNRPGTMVSVLSRKSTELHLSEIMLRETSTLGIRVRPVCRYIAERDVFRFESSLGEVSVKVKRDRGSILSISPEYEDCRRIALERDMPLREVYRVVEAESWRKMGQSASEGHKAMGA